MPFTFCVLAVVLFYTWFLQLRVPASFVAVPVAALLLLGAWKAILTGEWGLRLDAVWPAGRLTALFTAVGCGIILAAGLMLGTLHERTDLFGNLAALVVWGVGQQWILQTVFLREAQHATSARAGIVIAATLFAAIHLPNSFLTVMTFIGALGWCAIYERYPTDRTARILARDRDAGDALRVR